MLRTFALCFALPLFTQIGYLLSRGRRDNHSRNISKLLMSRLSPSELRSVQMGYQESFSLCKHMFRWERWNCPIPDVIQRSSSTPVSLTQAFPEANRETAFLHSLVAAGIVHHMIEDCQSGRNRNCPCNLKDLNQRASDTAASGEQSDEDGKSGRDESVKSGGCKDDLMYGFRRGKRAVKLLELKKVRGERKLFNRRNTNAGYKALEKSFIKVCRCSGVTRSCTQRTCWQSSPVSMRNVAQRLKLNYERAKKVVVYNNTLWEASSRSRSERRVRKAGSALLSSQAEDSLVYLHDSPSYCVSDASRGIQGSLSRECSSNDMSTCTDLCDECGYQTHMYKDDSLDARCNCSFQWCCNVVCETCRKSVIKAKCVRKSF